jgi:hypothetical protein
MRNLNFDNCLKIEYGSLTINIDPKINDKLSRLEHTYDHAEAALKFLLIPYHKFSFERVTINNEIKHYESICRASLSEFNGMEEALSLDLLNLKISKPVLKIVDTGDPILCMLHELRNYFIHIKDQKMAAVNQKYIISFPSIKELDGKEHSQDINIIDLNYSDFIKLKNSKFYNNNDIRKMIDGFNSLQNNWGITEIIYKAVNKYARLIVEDYLG